MVQSCGLEQLALPSEQHSSGQSILLCSLLMIYCTQAESLQAAGRPPFFHHRRSPSGSCILAGALRTKPAGEALNSWPPVTYPQQKLLLTPCPWGDGLTAVDSCADLGLGKCVGALLEQRLLQLCCGLLPSRASVPFGQAVRACEAHALHNVQP